LARLPIFDLEGEALADGRGYDEFFDKESAEKVK